MFHASLSSYFYDISPLFWPYFSLYLLSTDTFRHGLRFCRWSIQLAPPHTPLTPSKPAKQTKTIAT